MQLTNWLSRISNRRSGALRSGLHSRRTGRHHGLVQARCLETLEDRTLLATFTVTNTADAGAGSLRQAISDANVGAGADTISFASSLAGETITLTSGELVVTDGLDINGPGADQLTIDANQQSRIFSIDDGNSENLIDVSISGLTLTGGAADGPSAFSPAAQGGAISTLENLEVDGVFVTENRALSLGGGIRSAGGANANLTVLNSTISNNTVGNATELGFGAGVYFFSGGYVANTTLVGNSAASEGSAIDIGQTTPVVVANSTITGNTGGTAIRNSSSSNSLTLHNTIVAGNLDAEGNAAEISGTVEPASSNNLIGDPATAGGLIHSNNGNILGDGAGNGIAASTIIDTTLADNGGPTPTLAVIENSPAIDAGSNALAVDQNAVALTVDQRGETRVVDGDGNDTSVVDIGAFERPPLPSIVVTETDGSTAVSESVGIDTIEVSLNRRPDADVLITIESGDVTEFVVDLRSLTFTSDNWDVPQTVQVMGIDDRDFDGDVTSSLTVEVGSGSDADFSFVDPVVVTVTTTDNETTTPAGQGQAFDNHAPTLSITYVIALVGIFPSQGGELPDASEPLLGQIVMGGWNFAPRGYAFAEGQLLDITSNTALFSVLGTQYGGNGTTTFALPDLRGRVPIGADPANGLPVGTQVGSATVTLTEDNLPSHTHDHAAGTLLATGGGQAFDNQQPALALTAAVRTIGTFDSLGQIVWFAGNFAPDTEADGQLLPIAQHTALFSQLGTTYGGDGETTFGLPDLRGRAAVGFGTGDGLPALSIGEQVGETLTTLDSSQLPAHDHELSGTDTSETGGSQAFTNVSPGLALRYMVSVSGLFPSRSFVEPLIGEIAITAAPFADPFGWVNTEGQLLEIAPNAALFSLLGTTFGGDGITTFRLPDLRGRFATHFTSTQRLGSEFGSVNVSLTDATLPTHVHEFIPAEEYVVTTATDELDFSNADVSLREAIVAANYHAGTQDITFDDSLIGSTISLTGGQLELADDVTITGPGTAEELVIDAQGLFRVFRVDSGVTATLFDLMVTNGDADLNVEREFGGSIGGGILNAGGTLTLNNVHVTNSTATWGGGINNYGDGGIATITIVDSTVEGNTATSNAGGLYNWGNNGNAVTNIERSTFTGNTAVFSGGGIVSWPATTELKIVNSSIVQNTANNDGAMFVQLGVAVITNSTIAGNSATNSGGGLSLYSNATVTLNNSILAGNVLDNGTASDAFGDPFQATSANNLIGDAATAGGLVDGIAGNIVGVDWKTVLENDGTDPTLADNGGTTQTIALLVGTDPARDAIDAGENALAVDGDGNALTQDQRGAGFSRFVASGFGEATVDIGAFEATPFVTISDDFAIEGDDIVFDVTLSGAPIGNVVVTYSTAPGTADASDYTTATNQTLTFTPDGTLTQTITIPTTDDMDVEAAENFFLNLLSATNANITDNQGIGTIGNDDQARVSIGDAGDVQEGGTASFEVTLDRAPINDVTATFSTVGGTATDGSDYVAVTNQSLTFTPDNWATPQFISTSITDDTETEADETFTMQMFAVSGGTIGDSSGSATILGNDFATDVTISDASAIEGDDIVFDVTLSGAPIGNVVVTYSTAPGTADASDYTTATNQTLTFTPGGALTQTITIPTTDDMDVEAAENFFLNLLLATNANITDNQGIGTIGNNDFAVDVSNSTGTVSEDLTTDTFDVVLTVQPLTNVVITVSSDDTGEAIVDKTTLTFTPADWDTAQTVTITGVDDPTVDGPQTPTITVSVDDANSDDSFDGFSIDISTTVTDNDDAGFSVTETDGGTSVSESGTTDTFSVVLDAQPLTDVVLTVVSGDTTETTVDKTSLTFTSSDWNTAQTVTVTGVDDTAVDGNATTAITISVDDATSADAFDALASETVNVITVDDEVASLTVSIVAGSIGEADGAAATMGTVTRDGDLSSELVVTLTSDDSSEVTVQNTVTIEAGQATSPAFNIDAVDDTDADGPQTVTLTASATGLNSGTDTVIVTDDETASLMVNIAAESISETEGAAATTATVTRDGDLSSELVVTLTSDDSSEATVQTTVTIEAGQAASPAFNIDAVDDTDADGPQTVTLTSSATGLNSGTDTVIVTDDETASLTVSIAADSIGEGDGAAATTGTVTRDGDLSSELIVTLISDDSSEATVQTTVTIEAGQATSPEFQIAAVDDSDVDDTQTVTITASATGLTSGTDTLEVTDDDSSVVVLDVDGDGQLQTLSDGILILRFLAGFNGTTLVTGATGTEAVRDDAAAVIDWLEPRRDTVLDVDGDGLSAALTDGLLVLRYLAGFRGDALINGVIGDGAIRTTSDSIVAWLDGFAGVTQSGAVAPGAVPTAYVPSADPLSETDEVVPQLEFAATTDSSVHDSGSSDSFDTFDWRQQVSHNQNTWHSVDEDESADELDSLFADVLSLEF